MFSEDQMKFVSSMTPDEAKGLIGAFSISILNGVSEHIGKEVQHIKVVCKLQPAPLVHFYLNHERTAADKIMMVTEFTEGIMPCIDGEKKQHSVEQIDGYMLEIELGKWTLEVYGKKTDGSLTHFDLSPFQIMPYVKK